MKKLILIFLVFISCFGSNLIGQQDPLYTNYMFNPMAINPAYSGSRDALSMVALGRFQWVGVPGAPTTQSFAIHSNVGKTGLALGGNFYHEGIGPNSNFAGQLTIGYHLKLKLGKLSFAARAGFFNSNLDRGKLNFNQVNDPTQSSGITSSTVPTFDFGLYYYTKNFYVGAGANNIYAGELDFNVNADQVIHQLTQHFYLHGGVAIQLHKDFVLKPSAMLRYVINAPFSFDVNVSVLMYKIVWLGITYRFNSSVAALLEVNPLDWLRIGYSFDYTYTSTVFKKGSHEIFLGFDINLHSKKTTSPRFL
jgi:type IX secretion system PorP/SprF family membrane protein